MKLSTTALTALSLASTTLAQLAQFSPSNENGVSYSINIPSTTASTGSGDIYFQIQAPASLQWVGLGQGGQMAGANIFIMYADASGSNVTLSPRLGKGGFEPNYDTDAQVFLLEGSGIADNVMTANVRCSNCATWNGGKMDFSSSRSNWIWAVKEGSPVKTDSKSANLQQHDDMDSFTFDLTKARGGNSLNPFISAASTTESGSSKAAPVATAPAGGPSTPAGSSSGGGSDGGSDGDSDGDRGSSSSSSRSHESSIQKAIIAHGTIMGLAFVLFYPIGTMIIRSLSFPGVVWVHVGMQAFAYLFALAGLGLGTYIAIMPSYRLNMYHPIIGLVVIACLLIQPILGYVHHVMYTRTQKRTVWSMAHVWFGRIILTLGIINGGLGLRFAGSTKECEIAYGVLAGVMWVTWVAVAIWAAVYKKGGEEGRKDESVTREEAAMAEAK